MQLLLQLLVRYITSHFCCYCSEVVILPLPFSLLSPLSPTSAYRYPHSHSHSPRLLLPLTQSETLFLTPTARYSLSNSNSQSPIHHLNNCYIQKLTVFVSLKNFGLRSLSCNSLSFFIAPEMFILFEFPAKKALLLHFPSPRTITRLYTVALGTSDTFKYILSIPIKEVLELWKKFAGKRERSTCWGHSGMWDNTYS